MMTSTAETSTNLAAGTQHSSPPPPPSSVAVTTTTTTTAHFVPTSTSLVKPPPSSAAAAPAISSTTATTAAAVAAAAKNNTRSEQIGGPPKHLAASAINPPSVGIANPRPASQMFLANATHPMPDAEQIDLWFESMSEFEDMLEDMAKVSLDPVFKDELNAIDQWFTVLSDAERTAALYSLLQHASDLQVRFFITILQQMAKMDPAYNARIAAQRERHSVAAIPSSSASAAAAAAAATATSYPRSLVGHSSLADNPRYARMSYDGQLLSNKPSIDTNSTATVGPLGASLLSGKNWSVENLSTDSSTTRPPIGSNRSSVQSDQHRPHSAHGPNKSAATAAVTATAAAAAAAAAAAMDWRNSRASITSIESAASMRPGELVVPSQRGSMLGATPRQSLIDWEPKNFRWSSLSDSLEPYGSLGPDPNASALAQRLEQQMSINGGGGNRSSINNRISIMVQDPRFGSVASPLQSPRQSMMQQQQGKTSMGVVGGGTNTMVYPPGLAPQYSHSNIPISSAVTVGTSINAAAAAAGGPTTTASMVGASGGGAWPPTAPMTVNSGGNVAGLRSKSIGSAITIGGHAGAHIPSQSKVSTVHLHHQPQSFSAVVTQKQQQQQQQQQQSSPAPPQLPQQPQQGRRSSQPTSSNGTSMQSRHQLPSHPHPPRASRPQSPVPANSTGGSANGQVAPKPQDIVDFDLLKDIPAWLRTLRLHKYTPCFETMKWTDIIELTDEDLTNKGVSALGARRKMLKVFENIKNEIEERKMQGIAVPIP